MQVGELRVPISAIRAMAKDRRNLLLTLANAHGELGVVIRVTQVSRNQKNRGTVFDHYANAQHMTMINILAGKIHECWELIRSRYYGTGLSKDYDSEMKMETREQLEILKKYFGKGSNAIELARNEAAFHFGGGDVSERLNEMADEDAIFYIADETFNDLPYVGIDVTTYHLMGHIHGDNPARGLAILMDEVSEIGGRISAILRDMLTLLIAEALREADHTGIAIMRDLGRQPDARKIFLPCLLDTSRLKETELRRLQKRHGYVDATDPLSYATPRKVSRKDR